MRSTHLDHSLLSPTYCCETHFSTSIRMRQHVELSYKPIPCQFRVTTGMIQTLGIAYQIKCSLTNRRTGVHCWDKVIISSSFKSPSLIIFVKDCFTLQSSFVLFVIGFFSTPTIDPSTIDSFLQPFLFLCNRNVSDQLSQSDFCKIIQR